MNQMKPNSYKTGPDAQGHFGIFGGRYVAETLMPLILSVEQAYDAAHAASPFRLRRVAALRRGTGGRKAGLHVWNCRMSR